MKKLIEKMILLTIAIIVFGCSKDGVDGVDGATGPAGPVGATGADGNANVISVGPFNASATNWASANSNSFWYLSLNVPEISQSISNTGTISVFEATKDSGGNIIGYKATPYTTIGICTYFGFSESYVNLYKTTTNGTAMNNPGNMTYRVVVIPAAYRTANINVDWNNYEEIEKILNFK